MTWGIIEVETWGCDWEGVLPLAASREKRWAMNAGFELFDHTADIGVRAYAPSLPELVPVAGQGLYAVIGELQPAEEPRTESLTLTDGDLPMLLRDYVSELLLRFEGQGRMAVATQVEACEPGLLRVSIETRAIDRIASVLDREVKAITYHGLELNEINGGYELRYIVDI